MIFNISTTKNQKSSSYYSGADYINTTIKDMTLRTWLEDTWESLEFKYPDDLNISTLQVNGTTLIQVNKSGNWQASYDFGRSSGLCGLPLWGAIKEGGLLS